MTEPVHTRFYGWDENIVVTGGHSVKAVAKLDRTEAAHRNFGQAVKDLERLNEEADRCFRRLVAATAGLLEVNVKAEPVLPPPIEAAYATWRMRGPKETRVEIQNVGDAPLP